MGLFRPGSAVGYREGQQLRVRKVPQHLQLRLNQVGTHKSSRGPRVKQEQVELTADDSPGITFTTGTIGGNGGARTRTRRGEATGPGGNRTAAPQRERGDWFGCYLRVSYPIRSGKTPKGGISCQTYGQQL